MPVSMKNVLYLCLSVLLFTACNNDPAPLFLDSPPDRPAPASNCHERADESYPELDVITVAQKKEMASEFVQQLLRLEELEPFLFQRMSQPEATRNFTFLLPTNKAWREFVARRPEVLTDDEMLATFLKEHTMPLIVPHHQMGNIYEYAPNQNGYSHYFTEDPDGCIVVDQQASFIEIETYAKNGLIHIINGVLIPFDYQ